MALVSLESIGANEGNDREREVGVGDKYGNNDPEIENPGSNMWIQKTRRRGVMI